MLGRNVKNKVPIKSGWRSVLKEGRWVYKSRGAVGNAEVLRGLGQDMDVVCMEGHILTTDWCIIWPVPHVKFDYVFKIRSRSSQKAFRIFGRLNLYIETQIDGPSNVHQNPIKWNVPSPPHLGPYIGDEGRKSSQGWAPGWSFQSYLATDRPTHSTGVTAFFSTNPLTRSVIPQQNLKYLTKLSYNDRFPWFTDQPTNSFILLW